MINFVNVGLMIVVATINWLMSDESLMVVDRVDQLWWGGWDNLFDKLESQGWFWELFFSSNSIDIINLSS